MEKDENKMDLKRFIDDNQSLLSSLAVFAAITTLLGNLKIQWLVSALSFISIFGMLIIWKEINDRLPKRMNFGKLFLFRYVLLWGMGCLVLYWLLEFRLIWHILLFVPLTVLFVYEITSTLKQILKITAVRKFLGSNDKATLFQKIIIFLVALTILGTSIALAGMLSVPFNIILDNIKNSIR